MVGRSFITTNISTAFRLWHLLTQDITSSLLTLGQGKLCSVLD